ncbi:MAG: hypothetical protein ACI6PN_00235 [Polaribacter sp.]|uniref:hypothetical protein n=1 Tax=Polaribacter sp. TaxID=1920175 RepID=UPI0032B253D7|tara:strand:- start:18 stop:494 length:477 start_codon:yes stop_codon:yes gene_type:complete
MKNLIYILFVSVLLYSCKNTSDKKTIKIPAEITKMYSKYVSAWSAADFATISEEIYELPFSIYLNDTTITYNRKEELVSFLTNSFNTLEENNYGYSITNGWEHYKKEDNIVVIEMNFTRFLKDSTVMGAKNRTATYILRKKNDKFKISALIPHTPVSE